MAIPPIGRISSVDPRSIWPHEANDFTPWLAESNNFAELADTLQLGELEVVATEMQVGRFSADIVARDQEGNFVLVENQIEATDHRHLGQILTYLAGLDGDVNVVWIATKFLEEHRAAVDWLNANTSENFNFFAVELEVLRIGDSSPAPRFNLVAKPNGWTRFVRTASRQVGRAAWTDRNHMLAEYWREFGEYLGARGSRFQVRRTNPRMWYSFAIGRSGFDLPAAASVTQQRISAALYIAHPSAKMAFRMLYAQRDQIEAEFGEPLEWEELPERKATRIAVYRQDVNPADPVTRPEQFAWLLEKLDKFYTVFGSRVRALNLDNDPNDLEAESA